MSAYLEKAVKEIAEHRQEIIDKLVSFSITDMMLFWGTEKSLIEKQKDVWKPLLEWASDEMSAEFKPTHSLDVCGDDKTSGSRMRFFISSLSDKELAAFYAAASLTKSVLLASAFVKKKINAEQAFKAAFLEEQWQQDTWGSVDEALDKQEEAKKILKELELFLQ